MAGVGDVPDEPLPALPWGSLWRPGGGLPLASRCTGAGRGARSRAGGSLGGGVCVTGATGAGFGRGRSTGFGGGGSTCLGNVRGGDNGGVAGTGSGTESTSGIDTGSGGDSGGGGGGSGTGVTAISVVASGSGRSQTSRHACQPNDITANTTTCNIRAVKKAKSKDVCITRLASFQA